MQGWGILFAAIAYLLFLFIVASFGDRRRTSSAAESRSGKSRSMIYALSLAIYCTSWTFFGSVGLASTSGLDFLAIYLGPILMITVGYPLFRHIIAVSKSERITSIADFLASRYGKSTAVGALAAVIAVLGTIPYIALQLKAISGAVDTMISQVQPSLVVLEASSVNTSLFVSIFLAFFAILFGTRHTDATEHQEGLMLAVATESIVKLIAFIAVGLFVIMYLFDGVDDLIASAKQSSFVNEQFHAGINPSKFLVFTLLSFCAFVLLPRQFHVGVVENQSEAELKTARWMFPLYLVLINLFVIPVAIAGMITFGNTVDADTYVLALPLKSEAMAISLLVFIGGLSAATAMVIVACVALAIMISNNLIVPLQLRSDQARGIDVRRGQRDMSDRLLKIRRTAIFVILALAYVYYQVVGDSAALASIGLLSFAAIAQFAPAFFLGLVWKKPSSESAIWGMTIGFLVWFYTLFLPTILSPPSQLLSQGPFGFEFLKPQALFGIDADPLNHGVIVSLLANTIAYFAISMWRSPRPIERMQASVFSLWSRGAKGIIIPDGRSISIAELKHSVANYLGRERCDRAFDAYFQQHDEYPDNRDLAEEGIIAHAEQLLASAIGAASSRLVMSLLLQKHAPGEQNTIRLLDDASEALQYNRDLLQTALDQVEQGISVFDEEFRLSSWNRQFRVLLDLPPELGQVGMPLSILTDAIGKNVDSIPAGTGEFTKQLLDTKNTSLITLKASGRIVETQTNSLPNGGLVISWNDTTEKTNAARALTEANETLEGRVRERTEELTRLNEDLAKAREEADAANIGKTRFLAAVGHDILQPLNAARLYTSSLVEQLSGSAKQRLAGNVDDALESVEDILGAVLAISRLDAGALTPNITNFPVEHLFKRLEVEFRPIAEEKELELNVVSNQFHVRSDYSLLRRLLQNLVSNAIKYTDKGSVRVDARVRRDQLVFEITDTGAGIAKTDQESIFQEFHRLEEGKLAAPGLGLGLSIVKRLAATLDHPLEMSTSVGKGSTFKVIVPLAISADDNIDVGSAKPRSKQNVSNLTVVCIDNDTTILDGMQALLTGWDCTIHTFSDADDLLEAISQLDADILLADYHLDQHDGLEIISKTRAHLNFELPSILITADRSASVRNQAKSLGVTVLNKPLKPASLRALLARIAKQDSHAKNIVPPISKKSDHELT